jgi:uncharacterized protein (TIGR02996 family)
VTTNTAVGFRHALLDDPDDLDSRRIYADWLEDAVSTDADRARVELLRLQVRLAEWVPELVEREELLRREETLLLRHGELVLGPLLPRVREWRYQRGVLHVELSANQFRQRAGRDELRDQLQAAGVQVLRLKTSARTLRRVLASPVMAVLPGLDLGRTTPTLHSLQPLLQATTLPMLRWLDLSVNQLDDNFLADLAKAPLLRQLHGLDLRNNLFSSRALHQFIAACPETLQRLELHGNYLEADAREAYLDFLTEREVTRPAGQPFQRLVNSVGLEFRLIPASTFRQGSPERETHRIDDEGPQHVVRLTRPYWIGLYQVPQWIYVELMGDNPSHYHADNSGGPCHPVDSLTYEQALEFCRALSNLPAERAAGRRYRLPTEAEWEFAGRGGLIQAPFAYGSSLSSYQANFDGNSPAGNARRGPYVGHPVVVGSYPPNGFGLYDLHGNVWEWCSDFYDSSYYRTLDDVPVAIDPQGPTTGERHVVRGGSWFSNGSYCRVACRGSGAGVDHLHNGGFRLVMEMTAT